MAPAWWCSPCVHADVPHPEGLLPHYHFDGVPVDHPGYDCPLLGVIRNTRGGNAIAGHARRARRWAGIGEGGKVGGMAGDGSTVGGTSEGGGWAVSVGTGKVLVGSWTTGRAAER